MGPLAFTAALLFLLSASFASCDELFQAMSLMRGVGCGGGIGVGFFEPRPLGGLMIRGRPLLLIRSFPVVTRISFSTNTADAEEGVAKEEEGMQFPRALTHLELMGPSLDGPFTLSRGGFMFRDDMVHPDDMVDLDDKGQDPRISALEEIQNKLIKETMLKTLGSDEDRADSTNMAAQTEASVAETTPEGSSVVSSALQGAVLSDSDTPAVVGRLLEGSVVPTQVSDKDVEDVEFNVPFEWTPTSVCGLVLLTLSFGLLLTMLLLSLSSLIYGCTDEPTESVVEIEAQDEAPLLKYLEAAGVEVVQEKESGDDVKEEGTAAGKA